MATKPTKTPAEGGKKTDETVISKEEFDALQAKYEASEQSLQDITAKFEAAPSREVFDDVKTRLSTLEADRQARDKDAFASSVSDLMAGKSEEQRSAFLKAIQHEDGTSIIQSASEAAVQRFKDTEFAAIAQELEQNKDFKAKYLHSLKANPCVTAVAEFVHTGEHQQQYAVEKTVKAFDVGDDEKLVPNEFAPNGGIDPATTKPFTPRTLAKYYAGTIDFLKREATKTETFNGEGGEEAATDYGKRRKSAIESGQHSEFNKGSAADIREARRKKAKGE